MPLSPGRPAMLLGLALLASAACGSGTVATGAKPSGTPSTDCAALAAYFRPLAEREAARPPIRMRGLAQESPLPAAADLVALDGGRALYFDGGGLEVVDTAHDRLTSVGHLALAGATAVLTLPQHRVVVTGAYNETRDGDATPVPHAMIWEINLGDPTQPRLLRTQSIVGSVLGASAVGGVARVVITSPAQFFSRYPRGDESDAQVQARNEAALREVRGEDYLPRRQVTDADGTLIADRPLLGCADVARPDAAHALGVTTVVTVDPSGALSTGARGVADIAQFLADAGDRIELATFDRTVANARTNGSSTIYSLDGAAGAVGRLVATGSVPGDIAGNEALSVADGLVRVVLGVSPALAYPPGKTANRRGVVILREQGDRLQVVGQVATGGGDLVKRVGWFGDLAVFEDSKGTDYIVDTSRPQAPRLAAAAKLPGHIGALHATTGRRLLAVGPDESGATLTSATRAGFLDLADPAGPRLVGSVSLGRGTSGAPGWLPDLKLAVVPLTTTESVGPPQCPLLKGRPSCSTDVRNAVLLRVDADHSLHIVGRVGLHGYARRFVEVGDRVLAITDEAVALIDPKRAVVLAELRHPMYKQAG